MLTTLSAAFDFVHQHDVVYAAGHFVVVRPGGQMRAADDHDAIAFRGIADAAGPIVGVLDQLLHIARGSTAQRRHAPVQAHLPQRLFAGADADRRHKAAMLRERQRRAARVAGHEDQLGVEIVGHLAGRPDDGPRDAVRVQSLSCRPARAAGGAARSLRSPARCGSSSRPLRSGYLPMAVSPESMQASAPSRIALATSVASARVGRGESCMLSSICVAMITGRW